MEAILASQAGGVSGLLIVLILVVIPFIVKFWNWSKETSAQGLLYSQLSELVTNQRKELDEMYSERLKMQEQIFELKSKVDKLEEADKTVDVLKRKLNEKDLIISARDTRISSLLEELLGMKDRIHDLELKLKLDEESFCKNCSRGAIPVSSIFLTDSNEDL
jgi:predicted RNase H-like nuclease (RuvC/YqgF family)